MQLVLLDLAPAKTSSSFMFTSSLQALWNSPQDSASGQASNDMICENADTTSTIETSPTCGQESTLNSSFQEEDDEISLCTLGEDIGSLDTAKVPGGVGEEANVSKSELDSLSADCEKELVIEIDTSTEAANNMAKITVLKCKFYGVGGGFEDREVPADLQAIGFGRIDCKLFETVQSDTSREAMIPPVDYIQSDDLLT